MYKEIKCKGCRKQIVENPLENRLIDAHHTIIPSNDTSESECSSIQEDHNIFLKEDLLPEWIKNRIEAEEWSKGRLNCFHCETRIGAFNFINSTKCDCGKHLLPPVHLIKSKVDLIKVS